MDPTERGRVLEATVPLPPGTVRANGNVSDFDTYRPGPTPGGPAAEVGQTKSIDTHLPGYTKNPKSIYNTLWKRVSEVAGIGEGVWNESGHHIEVGSSTVRVFDVILPPEPLTAAQVAELDRLIVDAAANGVQTRVHIMH